MEANNNVQAMREAMDKIARCMDEILVRTELDSIIHRKALEAQNLADAVLMEPSRNCDVGTAEEQDCEDAERRGNHAATKAICETIEKVGSLYDAESVGNAVKMREALMEIRKATMKDSGTGPATELHTTIDAITQDALSAPPRNCDVGTEQEQQDRFRGFCRHYESEGECGIGRSEAACPAFQGGRNPDCSLWWAQMPYEKGDAK